MKRRIILAIFLVLLLIPESVFAARTPNDPDFAGKWWWRSVNAPDAWEKTQGSQEVVVAVIDTSIDINNPDLKANIWVNPREIPGNNKDDDKNGYVDDVNGWDFLDNDNNPGPTLTQFAIEQPAFHHGTLVAGIIGAVGDNKLGTVGVDWHVKIMPLRILGDNGVGDGEGAVEALAYALNQGATIINLSLVTPTFDAGLQKAISQAYHRGAVIVAAVGNDGKKAQIRDVNGLTFGDGLQFPACFDAESAYSFVLGVGAIDSEDGLAKFSNYGHCVDMLAPGVRIGSTVVYSPDKGLSTEVDYNYSGTSLAAPFVTGAAALIKSVRPTWGPNQIIPLLRETARNVTEVNKDKQGALGVGALDIAQAIERALDIPARKPLHILRSDKNAALWELYGLAGNVHASLRLPVKFNRVAGWDVFDYDMDGEDELIIAERQRDKTVRVYFYTEKGKKEQTLNLPLVPEDGVLIAPLRPHIVYSTFKPGVAFFFASGGKGHVLAYDATGKQQSFFETKLDSLHSVQGIDFSWSRRQERFVAAVRVVSGVQVFEWALDGTLITQKEYPFALQTARKERMPSSLYFDGFYEVDSHDAVYQIPGTMRVVIRSSEGGSKTMSFPRPEGAPVSVFSIDVGDWDGDGWKDVAVASGKGAPPMLQIYNTKGKVLKKIPLQATLGTGGLQVRISQYR